MRWMRHMRRRPGMVLGRLSVLVGLALALVFATAAPAFADDRPDGSELATAAGMMVVIMIAFIAAALGIWWAWRNGEFDEPEDVKYQMLAMADDEPDYWDMGRDRFDDDDDDDDDVNVTEETPRPMIPARS